MSTDKKILKLFPQPVFKYQVDNFRQINLELLSYIYNLQKNDALGVKKSNIHGNILKLHKFFCG